MTESDNKIIVLAEYKKQKALEMYDRLPPAVKMYIKTGDKNFNDLGQELFDKIPKDLDIEEIIKALNNNNPE